MDKIRNYGDLLKRCTKLIEDAKVEKKNETKEVLICGGTGCHASSSKEILELFENKIKMLRLDDKIKVKMTGCFGFCEKGPIIKIIPDDVFYVSVTKDDIDEIIESHIKKGEIVTRLLYVDNYLETRISKQNEMGFYKSQMRLALRNCGIINPEKIDDYILKGGYLGIAKCLTEMNSVSIINVIKDSGLRGRGGAGFPTGVKWESAFNTASDKKYIICNADEGDPGAFMDRSILEGDPHSVIEAMMIAGFATQSDTGYIYIRAEYPLAIHRLEIALEQARELGILGKNILGTEFNFDISIKYGAGAFVCGEETALINSVEGKRGEAKSKPPFPAFKGLFGCPTVINNVETLANIAQIILKGSAWYSGIGTEKSKGTKVFALAGKINNVGLVEVPMGTTLREIIYDIGGGVKDGKKLKAVQTGGPSGGCIPESKLDVKIDYESLKEMGSMMGSGGMIVMDEDTCMVDIAKFYIQFCSEESCGKCTPCRIGNVRLLEILEKITSGKGEMSDLDDLRELSSVIKDTALCGLGQTSPNPILSTLDYFYDEYVSHIVDKKCPSGKCKIKYKYVINPDKCTGCTICAKNCPVKCIDGELKKTHVIRQEDCIKCGVCYSKCPVKAIERE